MSNFYLLFLTAMYYLTVDTNVPVKIICIATINQSIIHQTSLTPVNNDTVIISIMIAQLTLSQISCLFHAD